MKIDANQLKIDENQLNIYENQLKTDYKLWWKINGNNENQLMQNAWTPDHAQGKSMEVITKIIKIDGNR